MLAFLQPLGAIIAIFALIWALWDRNNEFVRKLLVAALVLLTVGSLMS